MLQELVFKLIGSGISLLVYFLPMTIGYSDNTLSINTILKDPVTSECQSLVAQGHVFRINYSFSIIINNNQKAYERKVPVSLTHSGSSWYVNSDTVNRNDIQKVIGTVSATIKSLRFDVGDRIKVFICAKIPPDSIFTKSTGLQPSVIWNYYIPRAQNTFLFTKDGFIKE